MSNYISLIRIPKNKNQIFSRTHLFSSYANKFYIYYQKKKELQFNNKTPTFQLMCIKNRT